MAKSDMEVFKKATEVVHIDIPEIVGRHIANIMRDPTAMRAAEVDLDAFIQSHPEVKDTTVRDPTKDSPRMLVRKQLTNGSKVLESLLNRFLAS